MKRVDIRAVIKLDYRCNSRCLFCHRGEERGKEKEFFIEQKIKEAKKLGITTLEISGGEPTINRKILNVLSKIKNAGLGTGIVSNGRMFFYNDFLRKVIALNTNFFFISLHSHRKDVHDFLTCVNGSWEQTVKGIENITNNKKKVDLIVNCVVVKQNIEGLKELVLYLKKKKVKKIKFSFPLFMGEMKKNKKLIPSAEYAGEKISEAMDFCIKNKIQCFYEGLPYCLIHQRHRFKNHTLENANIYYIFEPTGEKFKETKNKKKYREIPCMECSYYSSCVYYNEKKSPFSPKPILEKIPSIITFKKAEEEFINHPRSIVLEGQNGGIYFASNNFFKIKDIKIIKEKERIFYKKRGKLLSLKKDVHNNFKISKNTALEKEEEARQKTIGTMDGNILFFGKKDSCYEKIFNGQKGKFVIVDKTVTKFPLKGKIITKNINSLFPKYKSFFSYVVLFESYNQIKNLRKDLLKIKSLLNKKGKLVIFENFLVGVLQENKKEECLNYRNHSYEEACFFIESLGFKVKRKEEYKNLWEIVAEK